MGDSDGNCLHDNNGVKLHTRHRVHVYPLLEMDFRGGMNRLKLRCIADTTRRRACHQLARIILKAAYGSAIVPAQGQKGRVH